MREPLAARLSGGGDKRLEEMPVLGTTRDALVTHLVDRGYHPITVDVTTPDVAQTGLSVVRVVVPGLYGNAPAAFPYLGGPRMTTGGTDGLCLLPPPWG